MKKNFVIPEIRSFELSTKDVVMASEIATQNSLVDYSILGFRDTEKVSDEYKVWKGKSWK